jgi:protein-S-isoprenylcysteine O-methyltransferase Ste14
VTVTLAAAAVYSVGCPLLRGTWWFYLGVPLAVGGLGLLTAAVIVAARTPPGRPFTTGPYRCSRHPMVVFGFLGLLCAGVAAASWLLLLLVAISLVVYLVELEGEERCCLANFGEACATYRARTPKYLGIPR